MAGRRSEVAWLITAVFCIGAATGCATTSDGHPVAGPTSAPTVTATGIRTSAPVSSSAAPTFEPSTMGVTPTARESVPPNALLCLPPPGDGAPTTVQAADPAAPKIIISLPAGWSAAPTPTGASLTGPDDMSGAVSITETNLDPAAAFEKYADETSAAAPISSVSVLPAENCGYSGQRLMGVLSGGAQGKQTYEDRIAHVWTNTKDYLVAIHVAAPSGTPSFDAVTPVLTSDFAITIP
jgi:hypothetical protein